MQKPSAPPNLGPLNDYKKLAFLTKWASAGAADRADVAKAELPGSGLHATAPALAELLGVIATGGGLRGETLMGAGALAALCQERIVGDDLVLPFHISWGAGLIRNEDAGVFGPSDAAVGHAGFGGSCAFADPETGISFAYVTNKMSPHLMGDPRATRLINALYAAL